MNETLLAASSSSSDMPWWAYVLCLIVVGVGVYFAWRARQKKIAMYRAWAAQYGFHYEPGDNSVTGLSTEEPFNQGHSRKGIDVFRGMYKGVHIVFFQYQYSTGSGKERKTFNHQVVAIGLPTTRPLLDISQENFLTKRFAKDIDFENQAFNDIFRIKSPNRRFAYDIIHARTMEWMLQDQRARSYSWRFEGPWLMTFRSGGLKLEEVFFYADFLIDILGQVPRHVWANN
ncbi:MULTISPECIES: hypothetical protein [Glycomyces]|uniref:DUF3137 domain-containing protein n=2 Tax=Glycomyces TaxID=58113 RepID=A0A9X3PT10_9ACTN|nr:hypothetical protein [Glycomyces lechevalierae]MDA1384833.1 hypothetical protein [Glycomyces lechevalierae]MDR7337715.1 hypothetical protein [Glycomyces lechevalierae]